MKLSSICPAAPCFSTAASFDVPSPGCSRDQLEFGRLDGRRFYAVHLSNHKPATVIDPRVAIVGLSPGGNQIAEFVDKYRETRSYWDASIAGAFAGLASDIIAMLHGLGLTQKLALHFEKATLAEHPDVYVTSLMACASLTSDFSSDDFDPRTNAAASRCATIRLVADLNRVSFTRLTHVLLLGAKAWNAADTLRTSTGATLLRSLQSSGKTVLGLPHPSGQNQEFVKLASLTNEAMPTLTAYTHTKWEEYRKKPPRPGRGKEPEAKYKAKRATVWNTIADLRRQVALMEPVR